MSPKIMALLACLYGFSEAGSAATAPTLPDEQGLPGVFGTHSSRSLRTGALVLGGYGRLGSGLSLMDGGTLEAADSKRRLEEAAVSGFRASAAMGLGLGIDLSLSLPWYYEYIQGAQGRPDRWSLGDMTGILKGRLPLDIPFTTLSLFATSSFSTSSRDGAVLPKALAYHPASGRYPDSISHSSGLERPRLGVGAGVTFDLSDVEEGPQVEVHANLSAEQTLAAESANPLLSAAASLAAEAFVTPSFRLEAEFRQERLAADAGSLGDALGRETTLGAGAGWISPFGLGIRAGVRAAPAGWNPARSLKYVSDKGVETSVRYRSNPGMAGYVQIAWQGFPLGRDRDHDTIPDGRDKCPLLPEDRDGFQDWDGCPDPDNDGDGVPDGADACPYVAEDHDGFEDGDGCPEMDNDHDFILDSVDLCPNDPEDRDGFQDEDGCPDLDDDKDGIPDAVDKCPRAAENRNGVEDSDGCPEIDTDDDGIPDSRDKCPTEDEIVNFYQDEDGCPDEKPEPVRDAVLNGVEFVSGGAELLPSSFMVLDGLAARLFAYPGTEMEIQGHLDDRSGREAKALSLARAEAVMEYLINRGVEARRLKAIGYGDSKPLGPNRTAKGRNKNRRIQIRRLN